ncbi:shikimate dehydrogenase [Sphingomonas kyeonggiensis]|uniref:Shikimate dehydrogenase (NADP(+)) n=1 Tax=Sphingomonas kyeonggiensis TaxID=1268553 RepID=A0A7W7JZK5_9SPHN|nr:shikimate dehydrogenase [Sphingomonas kyeonggiensis]MBB4837958.1 shikimate dehydrogenase [Sphingomonas kyeonggiensis]
MTVYAEVIGDPIAQSKSPVIHGFWLKQLGIAAEYRRAHVKPEELAGYFESRKADPDWRGCNITLPHKQESLAFVEDRGGVRESIGAINTVVRAEDGALIGTNTDAGGFYAPIAGLDLDGQHVVMIGAGGAARAILFALSRVGVGKVTLLNRNVLKGAALLSSFGIKGEALPLTAKLPPAALLVNASALGMVGQPPLEIDLSPLPEDAVVYDAVYAPLETDLLAQARDRDLDTVDGLEMLVGQAALAFELFFGAEPPRDRDDELRELLLK